MTVSGKRLTWVSRMIPKAVGIQRGGAAAAWCGLISSDLPPGVFWDLTAPLEHELPGFAHRIIVNKAYRFQLHQCKLRPCLCLILTFMIMCLGLSINEYIISCLFVSIME